MCSKRKRDDSSEESDAKRPRLFSADESSIENEVQIIDSDEEDYETQLIEGITPPSDIEVVEETLAEVELIDVVVPPPPL